MQVDILYDNPKENIATRLMKIRKIDDDIEDFLSPSYRRYWQSSRLLNDIDAAAARIIDAIDREEKIMIFGDYDVDGIMSSYTLYTFFRTFLNYNNISIRLPHRTKDGYGIKQHHLDEIKELGCSLVITVDNGITAVEEAKYAKQLGIDMVITDHHKALDEIPEAVAVVNPQISSQMRQKEICGATVALKLCTHIAGKLSFDKQQKKQLLDELLPFTAIATVADCMPLVDENRLIVSKGLELMNTKRHRLRPSLRHLLDQLNIKQVDTFHIGFMIAPRFNATGRMDTAHHGLQCLLAHDASVHRKHFSRMEELNTKRRALQESMMKQAAELVDPSQMFLSAAHDTFHEGLVGIVAGRITEKFNRPSLIMGVNKKKGIVTGSLRGPDYFNVVEMLQSVDDLLERYGGHAQAGGLTAQLDNLEELIVRLQEYCDKEIDPDDLAKKLTVDTRLHDHELTMSTIDDILQFGPYGEGNPEPLFLIENIRINQGDTVGKNGKSHLKLTAQKAETNFTIMQWSKGDQLTSIHYDQPYALIGKLKRDTYKGGFFIDAKQLIPGEHDFDFR